VPVAVTGHRTKRPTAQGPSLNNLNPPNYTHTHTPHPAQNPARAQLLPPRWTQGRWGQGASGGQYQYRIPRPLAPLIAQLALALALAQRD
jgi:hypothetical protein